jgi:hypothetical protein
MEHLCPEDRTNNRARSGFSGFAGYRWRNLVACLEKRHKTPAHRKERLRQLCLAGALAWLAPSHASAVRLACRGNIRNQSAQLDDCLETDFVSAFFVLKILEIRNKKDIEALLSKQKQQLLVLKARMHLGLGKAIEQLML